jgi:trimeric autotransporter adhesin
MNRAELGNQFQAEPRIVRSSTIERKQMSTKTTFKRVALVAVAALGLGVLSVAPSSAAVSSLAIAVTNGSNGNTAGTVVDTTTAARFTVTALTSEALDSISVTAVRKSGPAGSSASTAKIGLADTGTATTLISKDGGTTNIVASLRSSDAGITAWESTTAGTGSAAAIAGYGISGAVGYKSATFLLTLETGTAHTTGDYVYTVIANTFKGGVLQSTQVVQDVTITVAALATESKTVDPSKSSATLSLGATLGTAAAGSDSAVAVIATASSTVRASIRVLNNNAASTAVAESITVTVTGPGVIRDADNTAVSGKSLVIVGDGNNDIQILSDGNAGTATISVKTTSVTFPAKTVTFFAASATTAAASANKPVIAVGTNSSVIAASLKDVNGATWAGTAYIWAASAADALIAGSETPAACTYTASISAHLCDVSGKLAGTANFVVADSDSKTATTTVKSAPAAVRVSAGVPTTVKLAFDKATYAPGEKAQIWVTAVDAAGLALAEQTINNLFATGGISSSTALGTGSDTLTATSVAIAGATSATAGTVAGYKVYTVYMPFASGDITISATGGTGVALAGRVAVSATATVVNSSVDAATDAANEATDAANAATDAALAAADAADAATAAAQDASDAVAALSASVSKLISSLRAQITSLTNLVIKIQKKVRA